MKENEKNNLNEQDPYKLDKLSRIPSWIIILFLKYWAAAAAIFFGVIGGVDIGLDFSDIGSGDATNVAVLSIKIIVLIALFISLFINYIVRPIARLMYNRRNNTYRYNMINFKGFLSFVVCFAYHLVLSTILFGITVFLGSKGWIWDPFGTTSGSGIEPFTYGFCYIAVDFIFMFIKNCILDFNEKRKYKRQMKEDMSNV